MADVVFSREDNDALVEVSRGSKVTIELPENPTTGYQWIVNGVDELFLAPEGDAFLTGDQMGLGPEAFVDSFFAPMAPAALLLA